MFGIYTEFRQLVREPDLGPYRWHFPIHCSSINPSDPNRQEDMDLSSRTRLAKVAVGPNEVLVCELQPKILRSCICVIAGKF